MVPSRASSILSKGQPHRNGETSSCCIFGTATDAATSNNNTGKRSGGADSSDVDLAKEMNELSVQEREKIFDEIHGVTEFPQEAPEFVTDRIAQLDAALAEQPRNRRRKAYDRAKFLLPGLENDTKFKLMFLRADYYDAQKAARRIVKYFDDKQKLFGEDKLVKKITLDDFTEEDMKVFQSGFYMVPLPRADNSNRPVWFCDLTKYNWDCGDSLVRCTWYVVMATLEEEVTQMKGAVNVTYWPGDLKFNTKILKCTMKVGDMIVNLPCREASFHFCYSDPGMEYFLSTMKKAFGKHVRLRMREHFGSDIEMQYSLLPFGVNCPRYIFNSAESKEKMEYYQKYLQMRLVKDQQETQFQFQQSSIDGMTPYPSPNDVLVGRGCPYQNFSGNRILSQLIDTEYMDKYRKPTDRFGKTCMFMDVVKTIQNSGGARFLERRSDGWKIVDDKVARDKVSSSFRSKVQKFPTTTTASSSNVIGELTRSPSPDTDDIGSSQDSRAKRLRYDTSVLSSNGGGL